jgi:indolepyruvate ferredoxin oxidoreductase alpha subunit
VSTINRPARLLLSGNEAIALAAKNAQVALGTGYPGTPSTEILESLSSLGGPAQWAPNEKVALEVGLGAALGGARALVTMKHVGLNVAADPLFTATYIGPRGALVIISADDPGMASSQNEQDNCRYAVAAGLPMLEPSDSQEAYDFTLRAIELAERFQIPVLVRVTTRVCHGKTLVEPALQLAAPTEARFERDIRRYVMIPAYARAAHKRLRQKLAELAAESEKSHLFRAWDGEGRGIIASGVAFAHAREAAPGAPMLKLGMTYPLPMEAIRKFVASVGKCIVIEEGDPYLAESIRAAGIAIEDKPEMYRFGELSVGRVRRILTGDTSPEPPISGGKPPELCPGCSYRTVFDVLKQTGAVVAGDIGCYTLASLPPFEAMDTCVCMGASIGVGLGLRRVLPDAEASRVVSVIGDSTFVHSGITGLAEMVYNPPKTGHIVIILDNGTTAMTGMQEHPGTGRTIEHAKTGKVVIEDVARAMGVPNVFVLDPITQRRELESELAASMAKQHVAVFVLRRNCLLAAGSIKKYERAECAECVGSSDDNE